MRLQPPDHFLVIDPDPDLRAVLMAEIKAAADFRVEGAAWTNALIAASWSARFRSRFT